MRSGHLQGAGRESLLFFGPGERYNLFQFKPDMGWIFGVAFSSIAQFEKTVAQYPNIEPGEEFDGYPAAVAK